MNKAFERCFVVSIVYTLRSVPYTTSTLCQWLQKNSPKALLFLPFSLLFLFVLPAQGGATSDVLYKNNNTILTSVFSTLQPLQVQE